MKNKEEEKIAVELAVKRLSDNQIRYRTTRMTKDVIDHYTARIDIPNNGYKLIKVKVLD